MVAGARLRPALPVCACCSAPALLGGWVPAGPHAPHVRRWACSTCAGVELAHPFARPAVLPARTRIETSSGRRPLENNLARTTRVQLSLDFDA
jgi:hypothetical protein